jgi:ribosome-associated protein
MEHEANSELELPSKTQLKQEATEQQLLGKRLTAYSSAILAKLPISEKLIAVIEEYNRLPNNHGARRRQLQFIGKLMRDVDQLAVNKAISDMEIGHLKKQKKPAAAKTWRDRILESGDAEINAALEQFPQLERQTIRQLYREFHRAKEANRDKFREKLQIYLQQHIKS